MEFADINGIVDIGYDPVMFLPRKLFSGYAELEILF